ncbi:hypothetical protein [Sphingobacterium corticibacterium]|uniref:Response regulatory domain-containing protein n=1 Tax=Sphingobacterium corticibacterium TaxID=2484746 RepID=A0A4Q6Y0H7_9SPHI|nr:hypothetical protein [Sphingobacterium corticibacterium]RZF62707.1 hypothetical protein EWE74_07940 [Sphingobacterium corticibacterium]
MNRVTVGIVSNNRRLRVAYRLLFEQETEGNVEVLWDAVLGDEVKACQKYCGQPDVLVVDYEGMCDQASFGLEELNYIFPESKFLFVCDDFNASRTRELGKNLQQFLISKYCSVQTLLSAISSLILKTSPFLFQPQKPTSFSMNN